MVGLQSSNMKCSYVIGTSTDLNLYNNNEVLTLSNVGIKLAQEFTTLITFPVHLAHSSPHRGDDKAFVDKDLLFPDKTGE